MSGLKLFSSPMPITQKVVLISAMTGVAILGILASYLSRRKTRPIRHPRNRTGGRRTRNSMRSPNDALSIAGSRASARSISPGGSVHTLTDIASLVSSVRGGPTSSTAPCLTPQQLGVMGMEKLDIVINFWEDALAAHSLGSAQPEDAEFFQEIQSLLDVAYSLQEQSELLFLDERSCLFRTQLDPEDPQQDPNYDSESFASALDQIADLREFEDFEPEDNEDSEHPLYQNTLKQMEDHPIPCRVIRTELVHVASDAEYLAKLHCIRLAFHHLFRDPATSKWVSDTGRQILTDLICLGDKDPKDFIVGYEQILTHLADPINWQRAEIELLQRGVKAMTFFDIVMDFIILDAFKDLDSPPGSVLAVIQNRFLSNGFKETALQTALWSVLKAKKRMLKYNDGFMALFYQISEQITPLLAWGFFGPDENLKEVCHYFKSQIVEFLIDIFSFQKVRYKTVEDLSADILQLMRQRANNIAVKFSG